MGWMEERKEERNGHVAASASKQHGNERLKGKGSEGNIELFFVEPRRQAGVSITMSAMMGAMMSTDVGLEMRIRNNSGQFN